MIKVIFKGRFGNNLYQYCYGRILAEQTGHQLTFEPKKQNFSPYGTEEGIPGFKNALPLEGKILKRPEIYYREEYDEPLAPNEVITEGSLTLEGWFQFAYYFDGYRDQIRDWLAIESDTAGYHVGPKDLVLNLRLGEDYDNDKRCWIIHPDFYHKIIEQYGFNQLYICTDTPKSKLLKEFDRYNPTLFASGVPLIDFKFLKSFNRIAISTSSFSWWAAYLSDAQQIYFPDTRDSVSNIWNQGLHFVNEPRYIYLKARGLHE